MGALEGQVAVITGAASGIGSAVARLFSAEGAALALFDIAEPAPESAALPATTRHRVDVTDADSVSAGIDAVIAEHGRIDVLVCAAGILEEVPFLEMDPAQWDRTLAVDLRGVFLAARYAAPHMVAAGRGRIIPIASQLGIKGGVNLAHYVAAKAGVIGMTKALAQELAPHGVLVNAIAPGPVVTPLIDGLSEDWKAQKAAELPLGRFGRPEEIAPTALLLAGSPGGDIYVGQTLGPNSGDVMP
ncbi:SDR family NAD(P)-dependent oxidoreductase [Tomitella gaofuii]|uniref:SDR family NAD(P)-dependent oxidoreductase n=1 Tax=Tomitella gaofuii TaxID=2760083 RepID=UPI0015FA7597|nr:SDR family NAD(P)-dependent oxidoreductase [Tomitella gaofuii]